jgi:thermitase
MITKHQQRQARVSAQIVGVLAVNARIHIAILLVLFSCSSVARGQQARTSLPARVADQVIVAFQPGTPANAIAEAHRQAGAGPLRRLDAIGAEVAQIRSGSVNSAVAAYSRNPNVRYAEPNYLRAMILPNEGQDPNPPLGLGIDYFAEQYYLHNTGQDFYYDEFTGAPGALTASVDADIDATEAWDLHTGSSATTVAVLDSGVECTHADLINKCVEKINLGPSDSPDDLIGHGTLVASVIGANSDNGIGIAGVSWGTSIASIKVCYEYFDIFFGLLGLCDAAASAAGMIHAADMGYQVINMSYAGPEASQAEADAAAYAWSRGTLLVAAAANSYRRTEMYPAAFPEVIGVAATDWFDNLAGFSNFGPWVSLAAPGARMFLAFPHAACGLPETDPEGCYGWADGTSFSSPIVAGSAAVLWSYIGSGATNAQVRNALEANADAVGTHGQNMLAWTQSGRLNLRAALENIGGGTPPPPAEPGLHVGDLDASRTSSGPTWIAHVVVTVHDQNHAPASGKVVAGQWGDGSNGQCETTGGTCTISSAPLAKRVSSIAFAVTDIPGEVYLAGDNHDPDGDSDGMSIVVPK